MNRNIAFALLWVLCFLTGSKTMAQSKQDYALVIPNGRYWKSYWDDTKSVVTSPFRWNTAQWITAAGIVGSSIALYHYDLKIQNYFQGKQSSWADKLSKHGFERWGSGMYSFSTLALFYTQGVIFKNQRNQKVALAGLKAYVISGLLVQIPKILINRHRPYHDQPPRHDIFEGLSKRLYKSFPSGHTTSAFAVATVIATEYWKTGWVPILAYSIATMSSISRIYDNKHWASDVLMGAAFGYAVGKLVQSSSSKKWSAYPSINQQEANIRINYRF